jgi:hypothetical protein
LTISDRSVKASISMETTDAPESARPPNSSGKAWLTRPEPASVRVARVTRARASCIVSP